MRPAQRSYPRQTTCGDRDIELTLMGAGDRADLEAFVTGIPPHDLLFLDRDITNPRVIDAWFTAIEKGYVMSLCARADGALVGCTAIITSRLSWSRHVAELRVLVSEEMRGQGLGRLLIQECYAQAVDLSLEKLMVRMTTDQKPAIAGFEALGFRAEAVFHDQVKDANGIAHDVAVLSQNVNRERARLEAFGVPNEFDN